MSHRVSSLELRSDAALHLEPETVDLHSRAGSGNAHCTIKVSTFRTKDLLDACEKGDIARVRRAVADGVDVRKVVDKNWFNRTPLHYASWYVACETHPLYTLIV